MAARNDSSSVKGRLLTHAFCAAPSALVLGFCLIRTIQHFDRLSIIIAVVFGACLIADLLYTAREVRRLAATEPAKKLATQFVWSCIFFSMLAFSLGMAVSGWYWLSSDFLRRFSLVFWSLMTAIAVYPVHRDAKRLADAAGVSR